VFLTDAQETLMTALSQSERAAREWTSEVIITDGDWHWIAFTWDGASRRLYADSALVAEGSQEKLLIDSGKDIAPAAFWKGRIDDVRIYDRAAKPQGLFLPRPTSKGRRETGRRPYSLGPSCRESFARHLAASSGLGQDS
jgi:hypothetical protein